MPLGGYNGLQYGSFGWETFDDFLKVLIVGTITLIIQVNPMEEIFIGTVGENRQKSLLHNFTIGKNGNQSGKI